MNEAVTEAFSLSAEPGFYRAFGLRICSALPLPELGVWSAGPADVTIHVLDDLPPDDITSDEPGLDIGAETVSMNFTGVGRFLIRPSQRCIDIHACNGQKALVRLPLLGPVMAVYLHLASQLVLHASAIIARSGTIAFLGDKGAGKSTTAAAFVGNGAKLITDDLLVCAPPRSCWPAFSQLKLTQDAYEVLRLSAEDIPSPHPLFGKRQQRLPSGDLQAVPLDAVCVLTRGDHLQVERLGDAHALEAILRFAYILRYGAAFLSGRQGVEHFQRCAAMVRTTAVFRVVVPHDLDRLSGTTGQIDGLLSQLTART